MTARDPARAASFYPADESSCRSLVEECIGRSRTLDEPSGTVLGGVVPHAGWVYSGPTAAALFKTLRERGENARTVVIFGAVHSWGVPGAALQAEGLWRTPLGEVEVDAEIASALLAGGRTGLVEHAAAHEGEHSIEVQLPLMQVILGDVKIVPVAMPPEAEPVEVGAAAGTILAGLDRPVAVVGSTDLTHYGPSFYGWAPRGVGAEAHRWVVEENDRRIIDMMLELSAETIVPEAKRSRNACGAGAIAATIAACREMGASSATLIDQTTSYEAGGSRGEATDFVGYAAVSFERPSE